MMRSISGKACAAVMAAALFASSGSARNSAAPKSFTLQIEENFITMSPGHWVSSGAFSDEGTIESVTRHDIYGTTISVVMTLTGARGTFTWNFTRVLVPEPGERAFSGPTAISNGSWQMMSGTGDYAGITGQGTFGGTINFETGDIADTYQGYVRLAN